jgi:hypothetical protein
MKPILSKWSTGNFSKNVKINVYLFLFAHFLIGLGCLLNLSSIFNLRERCRNRDVDRAAREEDVGRR